MVALCPTCARPMRMRVPPDRAAYVAAWKRGKSMGRRGLPAVESGAGYLVGWAAGRRAWQADLEFAEAASGTRSTVAVNPQPTLRDPATLALLAKRKQRQDEAAMAARFDGRAVAASSEPSHRPRSAPVA